MKKIYQNPSIEVLKIENLTMLCGSPTGSVGGGSGTAESDSSGDGMDEDQGVKSNRYSNPVQWDDWQ